MRTYYVYISRIATQSEYQRRICATQNWNTLDGSDRDKVPAIWRVKDCNHSEHAKGRVLDYLTFPDSILNNDGKVIRIR